MTINNQKFQISSFSHQDTNKFYETNSPITLHDDTVVISNTVPSEIAEKIPFKTKEFCNLIYTGDLSKNVSFVCSESAYLQKNINTEEISIEFNKHLNWYELHQFKKIIRNCFSKYSLKYENAFSRKALMNMKNVFIVSILVIGYTAISTFGIYDFLVKEQKRTLRIYLICGLSPQILRRIFISFIFIINTLSLCISIPISTLFSIKYNFSLEGQLRFLPYLVTSSITFSISFIMTYYNLNNMFKHDICLNKKQ